MNYKIISTSSPKTEAHSLESLMSPHLKFKESHYIAQQPLIYNLCSNACITALYGILSDFKKPTHKNSPYTPLFLIANILAVTYMKLNSKNIGPCKTDNLIGKNVPNRFAWYISIGVSTKSSISYFNTIDSSKAMAYSYSLLLAPLILTQIFKSRNLPPNLTGTESNTSKKWSLLNTTIFKPLTALNATYSIEKYIVKAITSALIALAINAATYTDKNEEKMPFIIMNSGFLILTTLELCLAHYLTQTNRLENKQIQTPSNPKFKPKDLLPITEWPSTDIKENEIPECIILGLIYISTGIYAIIETQKNLNYLWTIYIATLSVANFALKPILALLKCCNTPLLTHYLKEQQNNTLINRSPKKTIKNAHYQTYVV